MTLRSASLKRNFVLNLLNTVTGLLFPLITFPYASRILLADGIGQVQFYQSIIDYITLFAALGIPLYAVREVARIRDDERERSRKTVELLLLHFGLTLLGYAVVVTLACTVGKIEANVPLFLLLSTALLFTTIGVPWLYQAVEDFKYITIRSIAVRIVSLAAMFLLVKTRDDVMYYAAVLVAGTVGNNVFNFFRLRKYVNIRLFVFRELRIGRHVKPALKVFLLNLTISLYINLNIVMLGFLCGDQAVGYYTATTKLVAAVQSIVTALGTVLLPRFSNMIAGGDREGFYAMANRVISLVIAFCLPVTLGTVFLAQPVITLFCGPDFGPSVVTLQLIAPKILFSCLAYIVGIQIVYPLGKENVFVVATACGAVLNVLVNVFTLNVWAEKGAAVATSLAELTVFLVTVVICRRYFPFRILTRQNGHYLAGCLLMCVPLAANLIFNTESRMSMTLVSAAAAAVSYVVYLFLVKDFAVVQIKDMLVEKLRKRTFS